MFSRLEINKSIDNSEQVKQLKQALTQADAVIIGAGAGMSVSAGMTYTGARFEEHFQDFIDQYHFRDMYSASFYPYDTLEEYWAYWSRHIYWNRYDQPIGEPYQLLFELVQNKDYFVITTNVDHCFQRTGFDKNRLFYTQGDYGLWQCSQPCHQKTYDNESTVRRMVAEQKDRKIPTELIPYCPICGKPMTMNLRSDDTFVQDEGWYGAQSRYQDYLLRHNGMRLLFLELGVGGNTPAIIKYPFWKFTSKNPNAIYACINFEEAFAPHNIKNQAICIQSDIGKVLKDIS